MSSPRTWGCFHRTSLNSHIAPVFPTHVGVFPYKNVAPFLPLCLPHARGGVSISGMLKRRRGKSSPRTWGCFYGPPGWRCGERVFPTHVGVFLSSSLIIGVRSCLPHARGGVSGIRLYVHVCRMSSPRTWWCFLVHGLQFVRAGVFPTHVGVFPSSHATISQESSLAHTCGGVSYRR